MALSARERVEAGVRPVVDDARSRPRSSLEDRGCPASLRAGTVVVDEDMAWRAPVVERLNSARALCECDENHGKRRTEDRGQRQEIKRAVVVVGGKERRCARVAASLAKRRRLKLQTTSHFPSSCHHRRILCALQTEMRRRPMVSEARFCVFDMSPSLGESANRCTREELCRPPLATSDFVSSCHYRHIHNILLSRPRATL